MNAQCQVNLACDTHNPLTSTPRKKKKLDEADVSTDDLLVDDEINEKDDPTYNPSDVSHEMLDSTFDR